MKKIKKITKKQQKKLKKREINKKDKAWIEAVKTRDGNKCVYCGSDKNTNAHHIIPREIEKFRFDVNNGVTLCAKHHRFSFEWSAHQNAFAFIDWLRENRRKQIEDLKARWNLYPDETKRENPQKENEGS
jgi:5-methylcytosine-specific restriction endonuclease McrA